MFFDSNRLDQEITCCLVRDLDVADITGLAEWPVGIGIQQRPLPLLVSEGVRC